MIRRNSHQNPRMRGKSRMYIHTVDLFSESSHARKKPHVYSHSGPIF